MSDIHAEERFARAMFGWLCEPGDPVLHELLATHGPDGAYDMIARVGVPFTPRAEVRQLPRGRWWQEAGAAVHHAQRGGRVIIPADPEWPPGLGDLHRPAPVCLWARGPAPIPRQESSVAIVGARASSAYGNTVATDLATALADQHWTVVSTGGLGIDSAALSATVDADGDAVAVQPCGLDQHHPDPLETRVAEDGLLLSAWPPGARPTRERMLANQRVLAALTAGTILVEASLRSTALHAVRHAVDIDRVAMVVPGPVTSTTSAGCHELLRADPRVRPVAHIGHVLTDLTRRADPGPAKHGGGGG